MPGEVSLLERRLAACVAQGQLLDCAPEGTTPDAIDAVDDWDGRVIRAEVLAEIAMGADADRPGTSRRAVRLRGALVVGRLELAHVDLEIPLSLDLCVFENPVVLTGARVRVVSLTRCVLPGLDGDELETLHTLRLAQSTFNGPIRLRGAHIGGELVLTGAKLAGTDERGQALVADRLQVGEAAFDAGFEAAGALGLRGARIDGNLDLSGAKVLGTDQNGNAIAGDGLRVGGGARLRHGFTASGAVRLWGAEVGGQLNLRSARLVGADINGDALIADEVHVGANTILAEGFEARGAVSLRGARIDGNLDLSGTRLAGIDASGNALRAGRLHVRGDLLMRDGAEARGDLRLATAVVDGHVALTGARHVEGIVLEGAHFGSIRHDPDSWPLPGGLRLRGLRFDMLVGDISWRQRVDWVRRQGFDLWTSDPYEQLAGYYARIGDESAARRVRIARHDDELIHLKRTRSPGSLAYRFWRRPFGWLVGYGYRRWPTGVLLMATLLAAGLTFHLADGAGAMVPDAPATGTRQTATDQADAGQGPCGDRHPCFNAAVYGADVVLPVIDFGQDSAWRPSERTAAGRRAAAARWVFIAVGWVLASVFVAAFTRLVQRD